MAMTLCASGRLVGATISAACAAPAMARVSAHIRAAVTMRIQEAPNFGLPAKGRFTSEAVRKKGR
jgi:hypothetical protein